MVLLYFSEFEDTLLRRGPLGRTYTDSAIWEQASQWISVFLPCQSSKLKVSHLICKASCKIRDTGARSEMEMFVVLFCPFSLFPRGALQSRRGGSCPLAPGPAHPSQPLPALYLPSLPRLSLPTSPPGPFRIATHAPLSQEEVSLLGQWATVPFLAKYGPSPSS